MTQPSTFPTAPPAPASTALRRPAPWAAGMAYAARLRWAPFLLGALISIGLSFEAPLGRKPFRIDWDVSWASLEFSLFKEPHIGASALIGMLAVVAVRRSRWWLALLLAVAVGWGWEMAQTTVIGHSARLADLLPDAIGAAVGVLWGAAMLWLAERIKDE